MKKALSTHNLSIGFKEKRRKTSLHEHVNLNVFTGELSCILGPNGAGKSTFIKTISGFITPLQGTIQIFDKEVSSLSNRELSHLLSIVLTDKVSVLHATVDDIVTMGRYPYTSRFASLKKEDRDHVAKALDQVGITHMQQRLFHQLSDGEKQKVLIAKALAQDTPLIVLDEPTAFLDFPSKIEVMQILLHLSRSAGKTILLSTHDVELALQVADRIWLMDKGKPIVTGCPEDLVLSDEMNRFFKKSNIYFDSENGAFRLKVAHQKRIGLEGDDLISSWVKRALERVGYAVVSPGDEYPVVKANSQRNILLILPEGIKHTFENIASLLDFLKHAQ